MAQDINIVAIPKKIEIGSPGKTLFRFRPEIVIPVPIIIAIAVKIMTKIFFRNSEDRLYKILK